MKPARPGLGDLVALVTNQVDRWPSSELTVARGPWPVRLPCSPQPRPPGRTGANSLNVQRSAERSERFISICIPIARTDLLSEQQRQQPPERHKAQGRRHKAGGRRQKAQGSCSRGWSWSRSRWPTPCPLVRLSACPLVTPCRTTLRLCPLISVIMMMADLSCSSGSSFPTKWPKFLGCLRRRDLTFDQWSARRSAARAETTSTLTTTTMATSSLKSH